MQYVELAMDVDDPDRFEDIHNDCHVSAETVFVQN
jgi:hypothetical protein